NDLFADAQRHITPVRSASVEIRTVNEITDANDGAESVIREPLQVVDEVFAREVLLRHRAVPVMLIPDVAVEVDLSGHHGLARQIDVCGAGRHRYLTAPADLRESVVLNEEGGVLDRGAAIARDQSRAFIDRNACSTCLSSSQ